MTGRTRDDKGAPEDHAARSAEAAEAAMMMRAHAVHRDPQTPPSAEQEPLPQGVTRRAQKHKSPAEWAFERLTLYIRKFEETLDSDHEVAMGLTGSQVGVLRIEGIGFFAPDILTFYGSDGDGAKTQLIQHISQLNVLLRAEPKPRSQEPARRIGFRLAQDLEESDVAQSHTGSETTKNAPLGA